MSSSSGDCSDCTLLSSDVPMGSELVKAWLVHLSRLTMAQTGGQFSVGTCLYCWTRYEGWDGSLGSSVFWPLTKPQ